MALIKHYTKVGQLWQMKESESLSPLQYCVDSFQPGKIPFTVMSGDVDITHDIGSMCCENGTYSIFNIPGEPSTILAVIALVVAIVAVVTAPDLQALSNVNRNEESPNNALGDRSNRSRVNQRLPTICGKVLSVPDLCMVSYRKFNSNIEEEISYFCVSDDDTQITEIKDGDTPGDQLSDSSFAIYGPDKSPNNSLPDEIIGDSFPDLISTITQSEEVSNTVLKARNELTVAVLIGTTVNDLGEIKDPSSESPFLEKLSVGIDVLLVNFTLPDGMTTINLSGIYEVTALEQDKVTLDVSGNPDWALFTVDTALTGELAKIEPTTVDEDIYTDWFSITTIRVDSFWANIVGPQGMYKDDGENRRTTFVDYRLQWQLLDDNFSPIGIITDVDDTITGGDSDQKGKTTEITLGACSFVRLRMKRLTEKDFQFAGQIVDEIRWRDLYGSQNIDVDNFGNCTTIHTRRRRTFDAPAIRNPQLTCIATERVNKYEFGVFAPTKTANTQAMQSLIRVALDDRIGKRQQSELDLNSLVATQSEIELYFGDVEAASFNYTFDSTDTSVETTFFTICDAVFSTAFRVGRVLGAIFEKPQTISSQVFTHRSKIPGSESWTRKYFDESDKDGIELKYISDSTNKQETYFFPIDRSAVNPKKIEVSGLRGIKMAQWRSWREFQKLKYQRITVDFEATQEGRFVAPRSLISVVKGSRIAAFDGYIRSVNGLILTLSQGVEFTLGDTHSILFKLRDGSTVSIDCTVGTNPNQVIMQSLPSEGVYTGEDQLKTEFSFGNEARHLAQLIVPITVDPTDTEAVKITGVNYDSRYYDRDNDPVVGNAFDAGYDEGFS